MTKIFCAMCKTEYDPSKEEPYYIPPWWAFWSKSLYHSTKKCHNCSSLLIWPWPKEDAKKE